MRKSLIIVLSIVFVLGFIAADYAAAADKTDITISGSIRVRGDYRSDMLPGYSGADASGIWMCENDADCMLDVLADADDISDCSGDAACLQDLLEDAVSQRKGHKAVYDQRVRLKVKAVVTPTTMGVIELENGTESWDGTDYSKSDGDTWGAHSGATGFYRKGNYKPSTLWIRQAYILHKGSGLLGTPAGFIVGHQLLKLGNGLFFDHSKFGSDAIVLFVEPQEGSEVSLIMVKLREGSSTSPDDATAYVLALNHALNSVNLSADITYLDDQAAAPGGMHFWNFGLRGDTAINGINLRADVELQTGKAEETAIGDVKYKGYAFLLGADYSFNDSTVGLEGAYGSGDKPDTDSYEGFITTMGSGQVAYLYDDKYPTTAGAGFITKTGLNNTMYLKLHASTKATPDLKVSAAIYYLRANETYYEDVKDLDSKNIGTEIDAKVEYKIAKNLTYYIEGGYLFAGDFYKVATLVATLGDDESPDDAYGIRHGLVLKF